MCKKYKEVLRDSGCCRYKRAEDFAIYPPLRRKYRGHRPVDDYGATSRRTFQLREHVSLGTTAVHASSVYRIVEKVAIAIYQTTA